MNCEQELQWWEIAIIFHSCQLHNDWHQAPRFYCCWAPFGCLKFSCKSSKFTNKISIWTGHETLHKFPIFFVSVCATWMDVCVSASASVCRCRFMSAFFCVENAATSRWYRPFNAIYFTPLLSFKEHLCQFYSISTSRGLPHIAANVYHYVSVLHILPLLLRINGIQLLVFFVCRYHLDVIWITVAGIWIVRPSFSAC